MPALDFRFKWSVVPPGVVMIGEALFVLGFGFIARVFRENTFTSATIEVAEGQRVVATGPYAIVRNSMSASALLYLVGTPLALGSYGDCSRLRSCFCFYYGALLMRSVFSRRTCPATPTINNGFGLVSCRFSQ